MPATASDANNTSPYAIVCSSTPDVAQAQNFGLSVINITSGDVKTFYDGQSPASGVAISPDGRYAYVINELGGHITVMDTADRAVIGSIRTGPYPQDAVVSPDGARIYVSSAPAGNGTIAVINSSSGDIEATIDVGISPGRMAFSPDGGRLYVAQSFDAIYAYGTEAPMNNIAVIDTANNSPGGTIRAGRRPLSVAVSPDGSRIYAACAGSGAVASIDAATGRTVATAKTGRSPVDIALSRDGSTLYAINDYYGRTFISAIDASSMSIESRIDLPGHDLVDMRPSLAPRILAAGGGSALYVADRARGVVYTVNATSRTIADTVNVGNSPSGMVLSPDGRLYVASKGSGGLAILNASGVGDVARVSLGLSARYAAFLPDGKKAYITNGDAGTVSVLDTGNMSIATTIDVGGITNRIAVSPDGKRAYVADTRNGGVVVIDTATDRAVDNWSLGLRPTDIAPAPDGSVVYVVHARSSNDVPDSDISWIDAATGRMLATHPLGTCTDSIAVAPDGKTLYAPQYASDTVLVMDAATGKVTSKIKVQGYPMGVAVSPDGRIVYVACRDGNGISAFDAKNETLITNIGGSWVSPDDMAITPDGSTMVATGYGDTFLIDLRGRTVLKTLRIGNAMGVAVSPAAGVEGA